jgi:hypothetical protein
VISFTSQIYWKLSICLCYFEPFGYFSAFLFTYLSSVPAIIIIPWIDFGLSLKIFAIFEVLIRNNHAAFQCNVWYFEFTKLVSWQIEFVDLRSGYWYLITKRIKGLIKRLLLVTISLMKNMSLNSLFIFLFTS